MKENTSFWLSVFTGFILQVLSFSNCNPIVQIGESYIYGQNTKYQDSEIHEYLSVPYAIPPLGKLRFQKPVPITNYPRELEAVSWPPDCEQYTKHPYPWYNASSPKSEDCLYLNIWTPPDAGPDNRKAVMYWIHGGGFRYDSIQNKLYTGTVLAAKGDIIVVTVNYRLGPFGFYTTNTNDAPGNIGIWDVLEGLRWVNKYIHYFGGDTSRITIAGESAGSISVGLLAVSPLAAGLFNRQIMESSSPTYLAADNKTRNIALSQKLAKMVGCATDGFNIEEHPHTITECMQNIDAKVLSYQDFYLNPTFPEAFIPLFGDEIVPDNPRKAIFEGKFRCNELLIGSNQDEAGIVLTFGDPQLFGYFGEKKPNINKTTGKDLIRTVFKDFPESESVVQYYLSDDVPEYDYDTVRFQIVTAATDFLVLCPDVYQAEQCAEKDGKVYSYFWVHRPSNSPWAPWMKAMHVTEIPFIFGQPYMHPSDYQAEELGISDQMVEIWSNFVKNGIPSAEYWPLYSKQNPTSKYLGLVNQEQKYDQGPHKENCEFLRPFFTP